MWCISYPDGRENNCSWFLIKLHIYHPYWFGVVEDQWFKRNTDKESKKVTTKLSFRIL